MNGDYKVTKRTREPGQMIKLPCKEITWPWKGTIWLDLDVGKSRDGTRG